MKELLKVLSNFNIATSVYSVKAKKYKIVRTRKDFKKKTKKIKT